MLALILALATSTPEQLYEGAIARLASLRQAPYLSYEMDQTGYTRTNGIIFDFGQNVIERRADRAFHNTVIYGGTLMIGRHYLTPDAFIPNASAPRDSDGVEPALDTPAAFGSPTPGAGPSVGPAASPTALKTIASVSTNASYSLTEVGDETIKSNFCGDAVHITLQPKANSDVFNVREMWIRPSDDALCAAIFDSWTFSGDGHSRIHVAAWLDERGFITNWRAETIDQPGAFDAGSFKKVTWQDTVAPGMFFSR